MKQLTGSKTSESKLCYTKEQFRLQKRTHPRSNLSIWSCDSCSRVCSSRIGLHTHQQICRWQAIRRFDCAVHKLSKLSLHQIGPDRSADTLSVFLLKLSKR